MTLKLRSRLRAIVATTICALIAAPALVAGTTTTAGAAPPGSLTGILTVGGEVNDVADTIPWRFYGEAYSALRDELVNPANFGSGGALNKGRFQIGPVGLTDITPGALANLDVFFAGIPRDGYLPSESNALQSFVLNGGGLVLALNQENFGDVPDFLTSLIDLNATRAFYGPSECYPGLPDTGPTTSSIGSHPVISGPFGPSGALTTYHTANTMTVSGAATARYSINVTGSSARFGIDGPVGDVNAPFTIETAVINPGANPGNVTSVTFASELGPLGTDTTFPFNLAGVSLPVGTHTLSATANLVGGGTLPAQDVVINVLATSVPSPAYRGCPGSSSSGEIINNNLSGTTVATIAPNALGAGSGPIVVTTDLDFFSNFFTGSSISNHTFALNAFAWIMDSILPAKIPDSYFPLSNPIRVYDSRVSGGKVAKGTSRAVKVSGVDIGGITVPAEATSIIANVTAVDPDHAGYFTVYPSGTSPIPADTSTHNFGAGENFANTVVLAVGQNNSISILNNFYNNADGGTHVIVDVIGYSRSIGTGSRLRTSTPIRALDTRTGTGGPQDPFHAATTRDLQIVGQPGIPPNVQAVVLNMTVTNATQNGGFVTVWPSGEGRPGISNLNVVTGVARPNLVVARVGSNGRISIYNESGNADILADIVGYFEPGTTGGSITAKSPKRELDTRLSTAFGPGETRAMTIQGLTGIPVEAKTVILKVTAVDPTSGGFLTISPTGLPVRPNVSNLNFIPGMNIPNLVITQIGPDGRINIYNDSGTTHVLVDVLGYAD